MSSPTEAAASAAADEPQAVPVATASKIRVSFNNDNDDNSSVESDYSDKKPAAVPDPVQASTFKYKPSDTSGVRQRPAKLGDAKSLGFVSQMYDMGKKGYLTEEERHMREMDKENRGFLTKEQVYDIVKEKLDEEYDVKQYKRVACWMFGLMMLLTISGFGTSYASAVLAKEVSTDTESGAVLVKNTGAVIGFDGIGDTMEFTELNDAEYSERRERVLREMEEDEMDEMHMHRKLAGKKAGYLIVFDQGKVAEKDLMNILARCELGNVVNIQRSWTNTNGSKDKDYDTICGPDFTVVSKNAPRGKKGKNNASKLRTVTQQVVFKKGPRKGKKSNDDEVQIVAFTCEKGWCYASGSGLQQSEGHPCNIQRGHEECSDGLLCYAGESITYGTGVCTRFATRRKPGQFCDISYGLDACENSSMCEGSVKSDTVFIDERGKVMGMGTCSKMTMRSGFGDMCDGLHGADACLNGLVCMDLKGNSIQGKRGTGICGQREVRQPDYKGARWYVDYDIGPNSGGLCVRDCPYGKFNNCGGNAADHDEYFQSWSECCEHKLWWVNKVGCVPDWPVIE